MHTTLLATSLRIPPPPAHLVHRARLITALAGGVPCHKLVLVAAPAGYGKTTLLAQWARASPLPVAWVSLSAEENDPERFLRCLVAAWAEVQPAVLESPLGLRLGAMSPDLDAVLTDFINVANGAPAPTAFVLDDAHQLRDPAVHSALTFLLDHLPPTLHFVLAGREDPPLPLARYRARQELLELRAADLQFSLSETSAFLNGPRGLGLTETALARLHDQLEGWIAGLQLVSLGARHHHEPPGPLVVSGRHRFIADYLREDVLADLPADVQRFLLRTSILDRLSGPLCDTVTEGEGGQEMLERLERANLFLLPLDDQRTWFRYHPLFADVLRQELLRAFPEELPLLHRRAAEWFLRSAAPEQAFRHAIAGDAVDLVTRIGDDYAVIMMESGQLNVVARWVEMIPEAWYASVPLVNLLRVAYLIHAGAFEDSVVLLNEVEERIRSSPGRQTREALAKVATVRCAIACFQNDVPSAEAYASQALSDLPGEDRFYRASIYHALGDTYSRNAHWDQAKSALRQALRVVHEPSSRIRSVHIYGALADLELRQGHLAIAGEYWRRALAVSQERELWGRLPIPVTGWVAIRMAELLYERNDLGEAWTHLRRGLELAQLGGDVRSLIAGYLLSARMKLTEGDVDGATDYLERVRPLLNEAQFPEWRSRFHRCQIELWLAQDRLRAVVDWAGAAGNDVGDDARDELAIDQLTLARALIVLRRQPDRARALTILGRVIEIAVAHGRTGLEIEALALQALARWDEGDRAGALLSLERALHTAEPEGYARLFADLGLPMWRLLQEAHAREVMPEYVQNLLAAFPSEIAPTGDESASLAEPLSEREHEVLDLMAAGLTNREIGDRLFISAETVKKHTGQIYAKLAVGRRTQAVARARALGLLDRAP